MSNHHDEINGGGETKPKPTPTQLCMFAALLTVSQTIDQTARYARNPRQYLEQRLGKEDLEARKDLLCIPDEVNRDIYGGGEHKAHFQAHIAKLFGKEEALFFITGVQAQLAALRIHCKRSGNHRVAWHVTSHLETAEERAFEHLYGLDRILIGTNEDENATVSEIEKVLTLPEDQRPAVLLLELPNRTLGCKTYSFSDLEKISALCKDNNVRFHLDGARIWEIEPYYQKTAGKTFPDVANLFDTVYVSFYKGLHSNSAGAMLLGSSDLITEAKVWQRRAGGNAYTLMYEVVDCERGYNENIGTFKEKWSKMSEIQEAVTRATEAYNTADGQSVVSFAYGPALCCQVRTVFAGYTNDELVAARDQVEAKSGVRVFEWLKSKQTVDEIQKAERESKADSGHHNVKQSQPGKLHEIEWMIVNETMQLDTKVFADGYVALCEELAAARRAA